MRSKIPVHDQLMRPGNLFEIIVVVELLGDIGPEVEAGASKGGGPAGLFVGVGPNQVAHGPVGGHFLHSVQCPNVVEFVDDRGESSVQAENGVVWGLVVEVWRRYR